ncbi:putative polyamine transporter RMV1 [Helianthus annuus]|nr:putative polyamine transporter RMV1 [Helianthus annuus]
MSFQEILELLNFLYAIGMLFEFEAFIKLRLKKPDLHRPYKVPLKTFSATLLCVPPAFLLVLVMSNLHGCGGKPVLCCSGGSFEALWSRSGCVDRRSDTLHITQWCAPVLGSNTTGDV